MKPFHTALLALLLMAGLPAASAQEAGPAKLAPDELRADLSQFRSGFLDRDRAYSEPARRMALERLAALEARAGTLDALQLGLALAEVAALADNGHSMVSLSRLVDQSARIGLRLAPFGDGEFRVLRTRDAADAELLGARLLAIDDQPLSRLRAAAHTLAGGLPAWRDRSAPFLFESPPLLHLA